MRLLFKISKQFFLIGVLFLAGCETENICNMTPNVIPQNQSNMYTITMAIRGTDGNILQKSIKPYIIIGGEKCEMQRHPDGNNIFVYDYRFCDIGTIPYYFELSYEINRNSNIREKSIKSGLFSTTVTHKYIFALDANRGPVGATINVAGCGLTKTDKIGFGGRIVASNWLSGGVIEFVVPPMECDKEYEVHVVSNRQTLFAGTFFIDASMLHCSADFIRLSNGEKQRLVFMLDHPAPEDGVNIEITTDIPDSVIMPEVYFTPGERTVSINIEGSEQSGKGTLFASAPGFSSLEIPIEVGDEIGDIDRKVKGIASEPSRSFPSQIKEINIENVDDDIVVL
jgi:hypothetical protein